MAESSLFSAGGHLPLTQAVQGNLSTGPCGPAGPLYGRTEHGRSRGARGRTPRDRKGVKRFSAILFSDFKREKAMWAHGKYEGMWQESHTSSVLWKK